MNVFALDGNCVTLFWSQCDCSTLPPCMLLPLSPSSGYARAVPSWAYFTVSRARYVGLDSTSPTGIIRLCNALPIAVAVVRPSHLVAVHLACSQRPLNLSQAGLKANWRGASQLHSPRVPAHAPEQPLPGSVHGQSIRSPERGSKTISVEEWI